MKKRVINYSLPATFSDFNQDTTYENFSRGKLRVFYKGETADGRLFSDSFSESLVSSLPYTPVVSYYDEEKEDFVGHATQQQILGIVDPCSKPTFEEYEGNSWCVCDVVLYTERPDKVGDLAKKIVGHKQSLELDPKSVKYTINYDEKKHFKNIEFTAGRFVGISVLGNDQKPAFTGSEFFTYSKEFEDKMKLLRNYCEERNGQTRDGGNVMNLQQFMNLSWGEISEKVANKIAKEYENDAYTYIVDMFEDSAIVRFYFYMEEVCRLMRVNYTCSENGEVHLGDVKEVRISYVDVENKDDANKGNTFIEEEDEDKDDEDENNYPNNDDADLECKSDEDEEKGNCEDENDDRDTSKSENDEDDEDADSDDFNSQDTEQSAESGEAEGISDCSETPDVNETESELVDCSTNPAEVEDVETPSITPEECSIQEKVSVDNEEKFEQKDSGSTSFTESERAEFEALKKEKKLNLVNSYKEFLTEEEFNNFVENIGSFDLKDLELELLKIYKNQDIKINKPIRAFAFAPNNVKNESSLDSFVRKNLRK